MGSGSWSSSSFSAYTTKTRGVSADEFSTTNYSVQDIYTATRISDELNPKNIMRECCDSEEHPNTLPVILALDVTGSMGTASVEVAKKLNDIMVNLYADKDVPDIEFCIMGIGDLAYDKAPIQMSQFESDIRIAEQLDQIYFESGGGGNSFESYTAAWYMGVNHCKLDCWNRGQKGIIITLGDELPNPYLPLENKYNFNSDFATVVGDNLQDAVETKDLLPEVLKKFNVYHISIDSLRTSYSWRKESIDKEWRELLGEDHYLVSSIEGLSDNIVNIIKNNTNNNIVTTTEEVSW